jgi:hypothetical protein
MQCHVPARKCFQFPKGRDISQSPTHKKNTCLLQLLAVSKCNIHHSLDMGCIWSFLSQTLMDGAHLELLRASQEIPAHQPASHLGTPGAQNAQPVGGFKPSQT